MSYMPELNILVIFGGRVDVKGHKNYMCLDELNILNLDTLSWAKTKVFGSIVEPRSAH